MSFYFKSQFQRSSHAKSDNLQLRDERHITDNKIIKREMSPRELAMYNLSKELSKYSFDNSDIKLELESIAKKIDQLNYMNMAYLAAALALKHYLKMTHPRVDMFKNYKWRDYILPNLPNLPINSKDDENTFEDQEVRHQEQILVYIYIIYQTISNMDVQMEEDTEDYNFNQREEVEYEYEYEEEDLPDIDELDVNYI